MQEKSEGLESQKALQDLPVILMKVVFALIIVIIIEAISIATLFPLKEKEVFFVEFKSSQENFVVVKKANATILSNKALLHNEIEGYIIARENINQIDEVRRYTQIVRLKSNDSIYKTFLNSYQANKGLWKLEGFKRKCKIKSISDVLFEPQANEYIAIAEYSLTDEYADGAASLKRWFKVTVRYNFINQKISTENLTLNPLGTNIIGYAITTLDQGIKK
ncbi:type IV secretion system protein [Sulfurimonas sp.]|uniref:type IV secretion system protein n=1 Tax=Sulfurimonas sp. TaxID=2022749 RepID=UPI002AB266FC|nr:VirB8/TrbF family protein [Sulfurimonas sp.]